MNTTKRPKYLIWTKDESGWTETADKPMTESQAVRRASFYRCEAGLETKVLPEGSKPEAA